MGIETSAWTCFRDVGVGEELAADLDLQVLVVLVVGLEAHRGDAGVEIFGLLSRGFLGVVVAAAPEAGRLLGDDDVVELGGVEEVAEGDVAVGERDRGAGAVPRELGLLEQGGGLDAVAALGGAEPFTAWVSPARRRRGAQRRRPRRPARVPAARGEAASVGASERWREHTRQVCGLEPRNHPSSEAVNALHDRRGRHARR